MITTDLETRHLLARERRDQLARDMRLARRTRPESMLATTPRLRLLLGALAVMLAVAAGAPRAAADSWGQDRHREKLVQTKTAAVPSAIRPDDRAGIRGPSTPTVLPQLVEVAGDRAFDWQDASVGGAATLALVALVAGGVTLRRDSRRQPAHG